MDDALTQAVLDYQAGRLQLEVVRNLIWIEAFDHLRRYRRKGEDEVSEFLLQFHSRIEGLISRFQPQGLPFRHFLLRSLRWQWHSFRTQRSRQRRQDWLLADSGLGAADPDSLAEPGIDEAASWPAFKPASRQRLVLLALKAAPWLDEAHLEAVSHHCGVDLAWLQACQHRLHSATDRRRLQRELLVEKRGDAYYRRLIAEDEARRETDPERRRAFERRAGHYRNRLTNLTRRQNAVSTAPTHRELAVLLGMPKGSVDSGLYHLKRELATVYHGSHDGAAGDKQRPQET